jgi:large subunit ribosomal protein L29
MKAQEIRDKNINELQEELVNLRKEQFNLRMQASVKTTHVKKNVRRLIARIKTILLQKGVAV